MCLNNKSELAGAKIPGLRVDNPKGLIYRVSWEKEEDVPEQIHQFKEAVKRIVYHTVSEDTDGEEDIQKPVRRLVCTEKDRRR